MSDSFRPYESQHATQPFLFPAPEVITFFSTLNSVSWYLVLCHFHPFAKQREKIIEFSQKRYDKYFRNLRLGEPQFTQAITFLSSLVWNVHLSCQIKYQRKQFNSNYSLLEKHSWTEPSKDRKVQSKWRGVSYVYIVIMLLTFGICGLPWGMKLQAASADFFQRNTYPFKTKLCVFKNWSFGDAL